MNLGSFILPVLALLMAPLLPGIINRIKAIFAGRKGQPLLQLYYDLAKLLGKGAVYSRTTSLLLLPPFCCSPSGAWRRRFLLPEISSCWPIFSE